jgi:PAS domain S-box-containing protein
MRPDDTTSPSAEGLPRDWLREFIARVPALIFGKDLEGRYLFVNEHYTRTFGIPASRMRGRTDVELFGRDAAQRFTANDREVVQRDEALEFEEQADLTDGKHIYISQKFPLYDAAGEVVAVCGISNEVTERRRLEGYRDLLVEAGERLVESLDLQTTLETIADLAARHLSRTFALDLVDQGGKITREIVRCALPWPRAILEKATEFAPLLPPAHPVRRVLATSEAVAVQRVTPELLDAWAVDKRHRELLEDLGMKSAAAIPLVGRGRAIGALALTWAETGYPTAEVLGVASALASRAALAIENAKLVAEWKEAARLREEVVGVASHDLRSPLQAILLATHMLLDSADEELTPRQAQALARIRSAAERTSRLIYSLLDFSQVRAGALTLERKPLDFHALVRAVCDEHAPAFPDRSIDLQQIGDGDGEWDEARLSQIVANLVANALNYSPADSAVSVVSEGSPSQVLLTVQNRGEPIDEALLPHIFEPFRRGAGGEKGSVGLGLYIAQQVAMAHGGSISVSSSAEAGTLFTLRLPRHAGRELHEQGQALH